MEIVVGVKAFSSLILRTLRGKMNGECFEQWTDSGYSRGSLVHGRTVLLSARKLTWVVPRVNGHQLV
jgi:hypothetical protein